MNRWIFILLAALLLGCSPQKRINRIVKRHPELLERDTITVIDTIRDTISIETVAVKADTIFKTLHDTTTIIKDNLTVKYFYDTIKKEHYLYGECDTIKMLVPYEKVIERKIPIDRIVVKETWFKWWYIPIVIIILLYVLRKKTPFL